MPVKPTTFEHVADVDRSPRVDYSVHNMIYNDVRAKFDPYALDLPMAINETNAEVAVRQCDLSRIREMRVSTVFTSASASRTIVGTKIKGEHQGSLWNV